MQIDKLKKRFALGRVVLVGDRGMITSARIEAEPPLRPEALQARPRPHQRAADREVVIGEQALDRLSGTDCPLLHFQLEKSSDSYIANMR